MSEQSPFEFEENIDKYLATLSRIYQQEGQPGLQSILVNSRPQVDEGVERGDYDDDVWGHVLHLLVPEQLFNFGLKEKTRIQDKIKQDLNKLLRNPKEFVSDVSLEVGFRENTDWRRESGLLITGERNVPDEAVKRIWGDEERFRLFLSHVSKFKGETAELKNKLAWFGVSCFVAHEDIEPEKEWQEEIEVALGSMHAFAALLTGDFHKSKWTDQEVGFAYARRVPFISVRLEIDPYG